MPKPKALISWSSGKDSAFSLYEVRRAGEFDVVGALTTVTETFERVSIHGVRQEILRTQCEAAGLAQRIVPIPYPCPNEIYEARMGEVVASAVREGITHMPQPRISSQSSPSPKRISPLSRRHWMSTSSDGSVKGKNDGRKRMHSPVTDGKTLYAHYTFSYRSTLPEAKGARVMFEGVAMMKLRDGKILEYHEVANTAPAFVDMRVWPPPIRGSAGDSRAIAAKRLVNSSSGPNTTAGRMMVADGTAASTAFSPAALLRP